MPALPSFHLLAKPAGPRCNLSCDYCFFLAKKELYPGSRFHMSDGLLATYTRQLIEAHATPEVTVAWQGGEPLLMGLDFFRRSLEHQRRYARPGMTIANTVQTNATLITDEWAKFFRENSFLVGVSIDGPDLMHDRYRRDRSGRPTFERVMRGLDLLHKYGVEWNAMTAVSRANADHPRELYRFLRDGCGARFIQFIPIVERPHRGGVPHGRTATGRSVRAEQLGRFLIAIFDEWLRRDVGRVFVQMFDAVLANWYGEPPGLCVFAERCGTALALEHNGDLYSCDHFVEPRHRLGNIREKHLGELVASRRQQRFGLAKSQTLPLTCRRCEVRFACHGGCPKDRFAASPDNEPGLNYLCHGYREFFHHIASPMRAMAQLLSQNRAPAEIMRL